MFDQVRAVVAGQHGLVASLAGRPVEQVAPVLAKLDRTVLAGADLAAVITAEQRLSCWVAAGQAASVAEFARCPTDRFSDVPKVRTDADEPDADDELALLLHISSGSAGFSLDHASFAYRTVRVVWGCWRDGLIDAVKVRALQEVTAGCDPQVVSTVALIMVSAVVTDRAGRSNLDRAVTDPPPVFRRRAQRLVLKLDPEAAARRRADRVSRRRVCAGQDRDGLGFLSGLDLPLEQVVAADGFLDRLARQLKHRGDPRTIACLRADVFTALLTGQTVDQILATHTGDPTADEAGDTRQARALERPSVAYARRDRRYPSGAELTRYGYADPVEQAAIDTTVAGLSAAWPDEPDTSGGQLAYPADWPRDPDPSGSWDQLTHRDREDYPHETDCHDPADGGAATLVWLTDWRATASTSNSCRTQTNQADGSSDTPDDPTVDDTIVDNAAGRHPAASPSGAAPWGSPPGTAPTASPPVTWPLGLVGRPLIELVVPYDLLRGGSTPGEANGWGLIPVDITRRLIEQAAATPSDWCLTVVDGHGRVVKHARTKHDPTISQKRLIHARDRVCTYPGCRRKADRCDLDHRIPWEHGGPTCPCNLHAVCRHHHQVKQANGWTVERDPITGSTRWTTPHSITGHNDTDTLDPELYHDTDIGPPGEPPDPRTATKQSSK